MNSARELLNTNVFIDDIFDGLTATKEFEPEDFLFFNGVNTFFVDITNSRAVFNDYSNRDFYYDNLSLEKMCEIIAYCTSEYERFNESISDKPDSELLKDYREIKEEVGDLNSSVHKKERYGVEELLGEFNLNIKTYMLMLSLDKS
jgi:hypothetical protein